jgi:hypothetical protein
MGVVISEGGSVAEGVALGAAQAVKNIMNVIAK